MRTISTLTARRLLAKRQRVADGAKILLDIAKESSEWFPPLKSALGGVRRAHQALRGMDRAGGRGAQLTRTLAGIRGCQGSD
jgi:hypothetical protein